LLDFIWNQNKLNVIANLFDKVGSQINEITFDLEQNAHSECELLGNCDANYGISWK